MNIPGSMQSPADKGCTRKTYRRPELEVYGDLREITQTVGKNGTKDGGSGNAAKTAA